MEIKWKEIICPARSVDDEARSVEDQLWESGGVIPGKIIEKRKRHFAHFSYIQYLLDTNKFGSFTIKSECFSSKPNYLEIFVVFLSLPGLQILWDNPNI